MLQPLTDTLSCDTTLLHQYRADEAYDYARELQAPELDWTSWLMQKIGDFFSDIFDYDGDLDFRMIVYIFLGLVVVGLIAFLLYRYQIQTLWQNGKGDGEDDEEDISMESFRRCI